MIANISIIAAVVIILVILGRRLPDARKKFQETRQVSSEEITLYGLIAQADEAFDKNNFEEAENLYVKVATQDPDNPKIYSRLGAIYLEQKNYYDAKDAFAQAVKLEPDLASRHINLGLSYMGLKDYYKASESFRNALKLDPKNNKYERLLDKTLKLQDKEKRKNK
ncbi:MAG: hypothetical protein HW405_167 [Candidatus Berkelbacteria bacterium]|nr:hypothetical protein [Candidatus Berkelbacteria bacterium]